MEIEKNISFFIEQQFPGVYREDGPELVQLVKDYYKFLETETNQPHYISRRFFEYRDIDTTLKEMLIFFQRKFLADLPLRENIVPFLVKNILELYRRKGTPAGIELFFSIFFNEYDIDVIYPSEKMLKVSNSKWRQGIYLQLFPNNNYFVSRSGKVYTYADLISRNILGSASGARAAISRINFMNLYGSRTPVLYIDSVQGNFERYDDVVANIDGELVSFGRVNGSLSAFNVDQNFPGSTGNQIGDVYNVEGDTGISGKVVVTEISDSITGEIVYEVKDGGYGYTIDNTRLLVSDQAIILDNEDLDFVPFERLVDTAGNEGIVIGQSISAVGVKMNAGDEFALNRAVSTVDRANNITLSPQAIPPKNDSSPGVLFPDGGDPFSDVIVDALTDVTQVDVITDLIAPFLGTNIDAADYEDTAPMSGTASPVNLATSLEDAFDIQTLSIGKISRFRNINPGSNYQFDVFSRAQDSLFKTFERKDQIIRFPSAAGSSIFNVDEIIVENNTGLRGQIKSVDTVRGLITVRPFGYYGFNGIDNIVRGNGDSFAVAGVEIDYSSNSFGDNAIIDSPTEFAVGRIKSVGIENSGFGYIDGDINGKLVDDDGRLQAVGTIEAQTQGFTEGYWADFSSHINGFTASQITEDTPIIPTSVFVSSVKIIANFETPAFGDFKLWGESVASDGFAFLDIDEDGSITTSDALIFKQIIAGTADQTYLDRWNNIIAPDLKAQRWFASNPQFYSYVRTFDYYSSGMRVQDSDFYQEYSYQIKSSLPKSEYEKILKETVHLAGTKMFGDFIYKVEIPASTKSRFLRLFNDDGRGSPLDMANTDALEASVTNFTADSTFVTADNEPV